MNAQDVILGARVAHVRELKTALAKATTENAALRDELATLKAHFVWAATLADTLRGSETLELWDGWNLILGSECRAHDRAELLAQAQATGRRVWIVLDGPKENDCTQGKVSVIYTGGTGEHRADRFICDIVRVAKRLGLAEKLTVLTRDKDFLKTVERIRAR